MTNVKINSIPACVHRLMVEASMERHHAYIVRRIAMTLHRWHEKECGVEGGCIERDEKTDKPYWLNSDTMRRTPIPDLETGALKRLAKLMKEYPTLTAYVQGDPRGASLYILRPGDVPKGADVSAYYSRGIAVHQ